MWVQGLLALVLLVQAVRFALLFWSPADATAAAPVSPPPASAPALSGYDPFFGQREAAPTDLQGWQLFGVRVGRNGASAILGAANAPQAAYAAGDEITPGLTLEAVAADHVVLRDGGVSRRLDLSAPDDRSAASAVPPPVMPSAAPPVAAPASAEADPVKLLTEAGLQSRKEGGRVTGYTLMPRGEDGLLRQAGLQPGDVLLSVNGQALDAEHLPEMVAQLKNDPRAAVTFERNGQVQTVTLGSSAP